MELHVSRTCRDLYQFDQLLYATDGNVIFANFQAARQFAAKINAKKQATAGSTNYFSAGNLNALGLIEEIFHLVFDAYYQEYGKPIQHRLYKELESRLGKEQLEGVLASYTEAFPPVSVYAGKESAVAYLEGSTEGEPNRELVLEEMVLTWLTNSNPAAEKMSELFTDSDLRKKTAYLKVIDGVQIFFKLQPAFGPENQDLISMLRSPALMVPDSLSGQLIYIREHWSTLLGQLLYRLLGSLDFIREEEKMTFLGPGPALVPDYMDKSMWKDGELSAEERYSPDSDWMPRVVMLAKNSYVWLNQLSREYQRPIDRLDQIPDETLDQLRQWGFSGLWLIGLWERSDASRRIKQMCGNPDAVSSAYSLARYQIASRLGGEEAYRNLAQRCAARGIRLASDMVPNHMGIDSDWVYDHPEWFVSVDQSPFPSYSFNGPDLSQNPQISINLEDHYYSRSDAAVVFKRYDHRDGNTRFIYHGNDGTSMPWNDTAQLNYLNPEVREAVIQTILEVARKFPIIRFDAAMTLTKKHYQRLWFPQPGSGGDIPTRADFALTREAFDKAMPEEFWREVVERVAREVPDTLLLAEAFWLMEGYFVRTLGMHRVYNSAFMHMLRNEDNEKYRQLIKNTLVYDPQILKRYVNFMNNPDEKTAVEQFGKGDKYFGICTVMATLPGLPMFGHGQVEGYSEKYGMEYYRPYWDETPDQNLIHRHQSEIFPLLHRRKNFANVESFMLYDFVNNGSVDENVYAYSNYQDGQASLVVYNNRFSSTSGWIRTSAPFLVKTGESSHLETRDLADALGLVGGATDFVIFRDAQSKLNYIRSVQEIRERGMFFSLNAYNSQVLMDFNIVRGPEYEALNHYLNGRGVYDLNAVKRELLLAPVIYPLRKLLAQENLEALLTPRAKVEQPIETPSALEQSLALLRQAGSEAQRLLNLQNLSLDVAGRDAANLVEEINNLEALGRKLGLASSPSTATLGESLDAVEKADPRKRFVLLIWALLSNLVGPNTQPEAVKANRQLLDEVAIGNLVESTLKTLGYSDFEAYKQSQVIKWMMVNLDWIFDSAPKSAGVLVQEWLKDPAFQGYLDINTSNNIRWFSKEKFEEMQVYEQAGTLLLLSAQPQSVEARTGLIEKVFLTRGVFKNLEKAYLASDYQLDKLLSNLV